MRKLLVVLIGLLLVSCGPTPTPKVIRETVEVTKLVQERVVETKEVTREVAVLVTQPPPPTHTPLPTYTPYPTSTPYPAYTPMPTHTPYATYTPFPSPTTSPTAPPTPTPVPPVGEAPLPRPTATAALPLEVAFGKLHYECMKRCLPDWNEVQRRCYRYLQFELVITNQSADKTVDWNWGPSKAIVTDGTHERIVTQRWYEWTKPGVREFYEKPKIGPGQIAAWTFVLPFIERYEWVKAIEFKAWDQTYRQEFTIGRLRDQHNYKDCGEPGIPAYPWEGWTCPP